MGTGVVNCTHLKKKRSQCSRQTQWWQMDTWATYNGFEAVLVVLVELCVDVDDELLVGVDVVVVEHVPHALGQ